MATEKVESVNLTPTWEGILPGLLLIIENGETVEARKTAEAEMRKMAQLADKYVAVVKANGEAIARAKDRILEHRVGGLPRVKRGNARVCGEHYIAIRPGEYEPDTFIAGTCVVCDDTAFVHRVAWDEVDSYLKEVRT